MNFIQHVQRFSIIQSSRKRAFEIWTACAGNMAKNKGSDGPIAA
jgi:hypothetical protein